MDRDKELMKRFCEGDKEAFEELIIKYRIQAEAFSKRYVHDSYIVEDIVQESFAYIYVYRDKYNSKYSFKTYLFTIIRNKSIDYIRKTSRISLYEEFNISDVHNPEEVYLKKEQSIHLKDSINKLKDDYKTAIYLIDFEEFSYKETAKIMGKSCAQIKILIFRARRKLKLIMEGDGM
jgi:RNA polymerase sigma-70 factor (ECF subfamily)